MPVETETSTTTTGGTTTVGATVRDGGPGGLKRTVDVYLHVESAKYEQASAPVGAYMVDAKRLSVWWKDQSLAAGGKLDFSYDIKHRAGEAFEGASEGLLVVSDRSANKLFLVRRFCVCPHPAKISLITHQGQSSGISAGPASRKRKITRRRGPR